MVGARTVEGLEGAHLLGGQGLVGPASQLAAAPLQAASSSFLPEELIPTKSTAPPIPSRHRLPGTLTYIRGEDEAQLTSYSSGRGFWSPSAAVRTPGSLLPDGTLHKVWGAAPPRGVPIHLQGRKAQLLERPSLQSGTRPVVSPTRHTLGSGW